MESYFGLNTGGFKQTFKQKLSAAAKYLPKEIMNKASSMGSHKKRNSEVISPLKLEEDLREKNSDDKGYEADKQKYNGKSKKQKKSKDQRSKESPTKEKQAESFDQEKELRPELVMPDSQNAVNGIIKGLFQVSLRQIEQQSSYKIKEQAINIINILNQTKINLFNLQDCCFTSGIPDEIKGIRPLVWRLLLHHLPIRTDEWEEHIENQRQIYEGWKQELIINPNIKFEEEKKEQLKMMIDHPLSVSHNSQWNQFFKDQDIWEEIEKDVKRTRTDLSFFYKAVDDAKNVNNLDILLKQAESKRNELTLEQKELYIETHADVLARVLFIYAKLNPGIRYVQGMNEVLAVLYYCFWCFGDEAIISHRYLESDLFFCFNNLMIEIRDGFMRELDREASGISGRVQAFATLLKEIDPLVHRNLNEQNVNHQFYALRWQMLLMCQEFDMSNVIVLWDILFSDNDRFKFLNYISCALVKTKRKECLVGDFAECMESLQRAADSITDVRQLINEAKMLQVKHLKKKMKEREWLESQMQNLKFS